MPERLHIFSYPAVERLRALQEMTEFFHAIGVKTNESRGWTVGSYVALNRGDQLVKGLVAGEELDRICARNLAATFKRI